MTDHRIAPLCRARHSGAPADSEGPGVSTFARDGETVYHCYSSTARGVEFLMGYYPILDRTPQGRDEVDTFQTWLRRHDEYRNG